MAGHGITQWYVTVLWKRRCKEPNQPNVKRMVHELNVHPFHPSVPGTGNMYRKVINVRKKKAQ
jgi:hypothetical protein